MTLSGDHYYLAEVAAALGCEPARVWHSGIANRNFRVLAPPGVGREQFAARGGAAGDDAVDEVDNLEVSCLHLGFTVPGAASGDCAVSATHVLAAPGMI